MSTESAYRECLQALGGAYSGMPASEGLEVGTKSK